MHLKVVLVFAGALFLADCGDHTVNSVVDQLRDEFLMIEEKLWNYVLDIKENASPADNSDQVLIKKFQHFGDRIKQLMGNDINKNLASLENVDISWTYAIITGELRIIDAVYETFRRFQLLQTGDNRVPSPRQAWIDMANVILNDPMNNVKDSLVRIDGIVNSGLFKNFLKEENGFRCEINQSPQQVLYTLYNTIALTELKGYTMIQFAYMILKLYNEGNFTRESQEQHERFENRTNSAILAVKTAMDRVGRDLYRCDPKKHQEGKTYDQLTELIQGYIQNEVDMNPEGTCGENCAFYQYTKNHGCFKNQFCAYQRNCGGKILKCKYVDSDMTVCPSSSSNRRYDYIQYENGQTLGRNTGCSRVTRQVDSWWRWLFWHCSYCLCLCDEAGPNSDRYFNLRPVVSNVTANKVVTGLRFIKKNRIFHLQIQEGKLLPYGRIDEETLEWVPVDSYKITDRNVLNGRDYHQMSWEKRAIDLDDLIADKNFVVTGVKFKTIGSHLNFEIRVTPFNFDNGTLVDPLNKSVWKDNPNTDSSYRNPRKRKDLSNPDVPTRTLNPSVPDSESDQFIEFINSDMNKDAGQTTVPFIDIQQVDSLIVVPLSGAGIYHKGQYGFGGFIAPKIITYDFTPHLKQAFVEEKDEPTKDEVESN